MAFPSFGKVRTMARSTKSFDRSGSRFRAQPSVLVICEDSKSGKQYLEDICAAFRAHVKVKVIHCGKTDPKGIVEEAITQLRKFNKVFCMIDRDRHPSFDQALALASGKENIEIIASYPCFEFWLLLHFGYCNKPYVEEGKLSPGDCVAKDLRTKPGMSNYDKGKCESVFQLLGAERLAIAREISPRVLADAIQNGSLNPSTRMHDLVDYIEVLGSPVPV